MFETSNERSRNRRIQATLSVVPAALLLVGLLSSAAAAAPPKAQGWWWAEQAAIGAPAPGPALLPAPPWVPSDGLYVASRADGADAMSALLFSLPASQAPATLVLRIHSLFGSPIVGLCPISGTWAPAENGSWADRPSFSCATHAVGALSPDGTSLVFNLPQAIARAGQINLALVPGLEPGGSYGTYYVSFNKPDARALSVAPPAAAASVSDAASTPGATADAQTSTLAPDPNVGALPPAPDLSTASSGLPVAAARSTPPPVSTPMAAAQPFASAVGPVGGASTGSSRNLQWSAQLFAMLAVLAAGASYLLFAPRRSSRFDLKLLVSESRKV